MRKAKVVIGAGFGDEGKGLMTDYFCSKFPSDKRVLNVRFNGGAQAGHTVVTDMCRHRHVFGHFGSGSYLPNVVTYLGPEFIVNPILFRREYSELWADGVRPLVYMHPRCVLTIPQDMMLNQIVERSRGKDRHGSCGIGIYETLYRSKINRALHVDDVYVSSSYKNLMMTDYASWHLYDMGVPSISANDKQLLTNRNIAEHYQDDLEFLRSHVIIKDESILDEFDYVVFEGAQGLLLDQNNKDYFPHLTPSNTGMANVEKMLRRCHGNIDGFEACYVTRSYLTRHGAGRFDTECNLSEMNGVMPDLTNHFNEFQRDFRYGWYDIDAVEKAISDDWGNHGCHWLSGSVMSRAFTHLDETNGKLYVRGYEVDPREMFRLVKMYGSTGPTRSDVSVM